MWQNRRLTGNQASKVPGSLCTTTDSRRWRKMNSICNWSGANAACDRCDGAEAPVAPPPRPYIMDGEMLTVSPSTHRPRDKHFCWRTLKPTKDALIRLGTPLPHFLLPLDHRLPHAAEWPLRHALLIGRRRSGVLEGGGSSPFPSEPRLSTASREEGGWGMYTLITKNNRGKGTRAEPLSIKVPSCQWKRWLCFSSCRFDLRHWLSQSHLVKIAEIKLKEDLYSCYWIFTLA